MNLLYPRKSYSILEVRKSMQRKYGVVDELAIGRLAMRTEPFLKISRTDLISVGYGDLIMEYKTTQSLTCPRPNRYRH